MIVIAVFLLILFLAVSLAHLAGCLWDMDRLRFYTKPLLMPLLALWYWSAVPSVDALVIFALLLGWLGDVFLMRPEKQMMLAAGMVAFAAGHVLYILHMQSLTKGILLIAFLPTLLAYGAMCAGAYRSLAHTAPKKALPGMTAYMLVLSAMSLFAALFMFRGFGALPFLGSLLFLVSDFILSNVLFRPKMRYGNFFVMLTYIGAQFLLALGFVN